MFELRGEIRFPEGPAGAFRPLDEDESGRAPEVAVAEALERARPGLEPIQVEVVNRPAHGLVGLDQRERRAADAPGHAERAQDPARQRRLAAPQLAREREQQVAAADVREAPRERRPRASRRRLVREHQLHGELTTPRNSATRSPAITPRSPARAARSPASACSSTPAAAASGGGTPPASSAATMPVSTSPLPAVAMPGLPRSQTQVGGSGPCTSVCAPFSTQTPPNLSAIARAEARRSRC